MGSGSVTAGVSVGDGVSSGVVSVIVEDGKIEDVESSGTQRELE